MSLEDMKNTDIRTVDRTELVDLKDIEINPNAAPEEKLIEFAKQIKNPYCFLYGDYVVKLEFAEKGRTIEDCFSDYIDTLM